MLTNKQKLAVQRAEISTRYICAAAIGALGVMIAYHSLAWFLLVVKGVL